MEKKDIIKSLISFYKGITNRCIVIDTNNNDGISKLALKVLVKEIDTPLNVTFISPVKDYFNEIFPNFQEGVKVSTKYSLSQHKISFNIMDKSMIKDPPKDTDILIIYPCDNIKDKDIYKIMDNSLNIKKTVLISKVVEEPHKSLKKFDPIFISMKPSDNAVYYEAMKQKIFNLR